MKIRLGTLSDEDQIREVHLVSFDERERLLIADLASRLLREASTPETFHLVAEVGDGVVGHVAFSPVWRQGGGELLGYLLAPLAVRPPHQKSGVGSKLVREGLQMLRERNVAVVLVYGDPDYYGRFGFEEVTGGKFSPPFALSYPNGWQVLDSAGEGETVSEGAIQCVEALNDPELW